MTNGDPITIAAEVQGERPQAFTTYRELLNAAPLDHAQREKLRDAIRLLQKTPDQVKADLAIFRQAADLRDKIAHARSEAVQRGEEAARIACKEYAEETRQWLASRNKEYSKLVIAMETIQRLILDAENRLAHDLLALEHANFELLGIRQPLRIDDGHYQA